MSTPFSIDQLACPTPHARYERVMLAHGGGGKLSADLLQQVFLPAFSNDVLAALEDQASLDLFGKDYRLAFTTDSYVVHPLFFPGGDIGKLAVHGTVNDLAVGGAVPKVLSAAFILEEGTPLDMLARVVDSMRIACSEASVQLVAGDTKVVDRGRGDQLFITTSGIGLIPPGRCLSIRNLQPGDHILISGTIGDHGMAVMSVREGLEFETVLQSDTAPLNSLTSRMLEVCPSIRWMRDPTRGGLASALNEAATATGLGIRIVEAAIPVRPEVRAACELLGLDPLYVANEGKLVAAVSPENSSPLLKTMRGHPLSKDAQIIGKVVSDHPGLVVTKSQIGGERIVPMLSGEQLPRIC